MLVYIIAEAERKWIPTIKEALTNRIIADTFHLKKRYIILFSNATIPFKSEKLNIVWSPLGLREN